MSLYQYKKQIIERLEQHNYPAELINHICLASIVSPSQPEQDYVRQNTILIKQDVPVLSIWYIWGLNSTVKPYHKNHHKYPYHFVRHIAKVADKYWVFLQASWGIDVIELSDILSINEQNIQYNGVKSTANLMLNSILSKLNNDPEISLFNYVQELLDIDLNTYYCTLLNEKCIDLHEQDKNKVVWK